MENNNFQTPKPPVTDYSINNKEHDKQNTPPKVTQGEQLPDNKILVKKRRLYINNSEEK